MARTTHLRGEFAAASLKRSLPLRTRDLEPDLRGEFAAASLKRAVDLHAHDVAEISAANSPRPH